MYLYKTTIYFTPADVAGLNSTEQTTHTNAKTDFEVASKKDEALKVDEIMIAETTFELEKTYEEFKDLIIGTIEWEDVRYIENQNSYHIYITSGEAL